MLLITEVIRSGRKLLTSPFWGKYIGGCGPAAIDFRACAERIGGLNTSTLARGEKERTLGVKDW